MDLENPYMYGYFLVLLQDSGCDYFLRLDPDMCGRIKLVCNQRAKRGKQDLANGN